VNPSSTDARLVGYTRVSTQDQDLALQIDALRKHGIAKELIFTDKASGATHERPGLDACFGELRNGDVLLVWRLDRLGRSVRHLVTLIDQLRDRGVGFRSICDGAIDTTTPSGELIFLVSLRLHSSNGGSFKNGPKPALLPPALEVVRVAGRHWMPTHLKLSSRTSCFATSRSAWMIFAQR
jgi:hypothetical protein